MYVKATNMYEGEEKSGVITDEKGGPRCEKHLFWDVDYVFFGVSWTKYCIHGIILFRE